MNQTHPTKPKSVPPDFFENDAYLKKEMEMPEEAKLLQWRERWLNDTQHHAHQ